jgi:hypothetical protein
MIQGMFIRLEKPGHEGRGGYISPYKITARHGKGIKFI